MASLQKVETATRSDELVRALDAVGLDEGKIAEKLKEMFGATESKREFVHDKKLRRMVEVVKKRKNWKTQAQAVKYLLEIRGLLFQLPPAAPVTIDARTLQIAEDVRGLHPRDVMLELGSAVKLLKEQLGAKVLSEVEGKAVQDIEDAEIVSGGVT